MIASPLFHIGHSLHVGLICTGVAMYSVTVMTNVIEFYKIIKPVLHAFHIRWTFVLHWILGFMFQIRSYRGNRKDFLLSHVIFTVILFCFTFVSCLLHIRFVSRWTFASCRSYRCGKVQCDYCEDSN